MFERCECEYVNCHLTSGVVGEEKREIDRFVVRTLFPFLCVSRPSSLPAAGSVHVNVNVHVDKMLQQHA